ncbi:hypothetical protein HD554DRAFT_2035201 [Boletus coccyginus]|nr:hypothetical protein HD554DRAFT_2035201 [Boletus coccyginus]
MLSFALGLFFGVLGAYAGRGRYSNEFGTGTYMNSWVGAVCEMIGIIEYLYFGHVIYYKHWLISTTKPCYVTPESASKSNKDLEPNRMDCLPTWGNVSMNLYTQAGRQSCLKWIGKIYI